MTRRLWRPTLPALRNCQSMSCPSRQHDDAVMAFADIQDAKRVLDVLGKRLARYELTLHPDKTRFVDFRSDRSDGDHLEADGSSFTFLGFCHVWGKSRRGNR